MLSFSSSTLLASLLLYLTSTTIAQKRACDAPAPCINFYDKAEGNVRGGTDAGAPTKRNLETIIIGILVGRGSENDHTEHH